jgi:UDP-glucose 4-epimerase
MTAVIIGCNGYLGKHLTSFLLKEGWKVYRYGKKEVDDLSLPDYSRLNVEHKEDFEVLNTDVDFIFYFSGITGVAAAYNNYESYIDVNEKGLLHLLNKVRYDNSKARIVFPSTRLIYKGMKDELLSEKSEKEFKTIYALNKWFGEQIIQQYSRYFGVPFSIFRICVPYGNLFNEAYSYGTIGFFLNKARAGETISLFGNGDQKRTFSHVEDICCQIHKALINPNSKNNVYNTMGETYSLKQVADKIASKFNVQVKSVDWPPMDESLESGDTVFNSEKIAALIKKPLRHSFEDWLHKLSLDDTKMQ